MATTRQIEALAAEIGEAIYLDIAKWHLYLSNAHLHIPLAEKLYPLLAEDRLSEDAVLQILRDFPVKVGGGRYEVSLLNLLPTQGQRELLNLLEAFQQNL